MCTLSKSHYSILMKFYPLLHIVICKAYNYVNYVNTKFFSENDKWQKKYFIVYTLSFGKIILYLKLKNFTKRCLVHHHKCKLIFSKKQNWYFCTKSVVVYLKQHKITTIFALIDEYHIWQIEAHSGDSVCIELTW